jgi:hypothetical protein
MKHTWFLAVAALALILVSHSGAQQMPQAPRFELDPRWPVIPNNWVLGEVTSISVDRNDNIWVLHVPQSIPEAQRANAAPPVLQFDAAGETPDQLGRARQRLRMDGTRAWHLCGRERFRVDRRARRLASCDDSRRQRRHDSEVHDGGQARYEDREQRPEQGQR